jgi:hypothetical protein
LAAPTSRADFIAPIFRWTERKNFFAHFPPRFRITTGRPFNQTDAHTDTSIQDYNDCYEKRFAAFAHQGRLNDGTTKFIIVNPPAGNRFYRLLKP